MEQPTYDLTSELSLLDPKRIRLFVDKFQNLVLDECALINQGIWISNQILSGFWMDFPVPRCVYQPGNIV